MFVRKAAGKPRVEQLTEAALFQDTCAEDRAQQCGQASSIGESRRGGVQQNLLRGKVLVRRELEARCAQIIAQVDEIFSGEHRRTRGRVSFRPWS